MGRKYSVVNDALQARERCKGAEPRLIRVLNFPPPPSNAPPARD